MTHPELIIVRNAPDARDARRAILSALRSTRPSNPSRDLPWAECKEASVRARAQWLLLQDWNQENPSRPQNPSETRLLGKLETARWIEVMAEHGTDGVWDHEGYPVCLDIDNKPEEPQRLPVPLELQQRIRSWNDEFSQLATSITKTGDLTLNAWLLGHDICGLALVKEMRTELSKSGSVLDRWTIRFIPHAPAIPPDGLMPWTDTCEKAKQEYGLPAVTDNVSGGVGHVAGYADTPKFGLHPEMLPHLHSVHDIDGFAVAMSAFQDEMHRWNSLKEAEAEKLSHMSDDARAFEHVRTDVLANWLSQQCAVILNWTFMARYRLFHEKHTVPNNEVQVARFIRIVADNSSSGLWDYAGYMVEPEDVPVRPALRRRLEAWLDLYESARTWDDESNRPFKLNEAAFERMGDALARAFQGELPGWQVVRRL